MQNIFDDMLHKTIECCVDDLVVKSKKKFDHIQHLCQVFERLRKCQLKMNPLKCAFGVTSGKFLGFVVRHKGIKIDQSKIKAVQDMPEPKNLKELRALQGHLAYIRRFISNLAGCCHPFSHLIKKEHLLNGTSRATKLSRKLRSTCQILQCWERQSPASLSYFI